MVAEEGLEPPANSFLLRYTRCNLHEVSNCKGLCRTIKTKHILISKIKYKRAKYERFNFKIWNQYNHTTQQTL